IPATQSNTVTPTTSTSGSTTAMTGSTSPMFSSSSVSTMNVSTNFSSTDNTTMTMTTATTTTATTTTVKPVPDISHNTDLAMNVLNFTVSNDNTSDIQYLNANLTREQLLTMLNAQFRPISFSTELIHVNTSQMPAVYVLRVMFLQKNTVNNTQALGGQINSALRNLENMPDFNTPNLNVTSTRVSQFLNSTMDVCSAVNICPVDYTCLVDGCRQMCRDKTCSSHGTCYVSVTATGTAKAMCQCDSEYATEYMGDNCEYSRHGRLEIIAIIAGVLGAVILILIVVIIVLCLKYNRTSAHSKYNVSSADYSNTAYDGAQQK
ncbi:unnamed protein product, partial [Candidula unifasciata]